MRRMWDPAESIARRKYQTCCVVAGSDRGEEGGGSAAHKMQSTLLFLRSLSLSLSRCGGGAQPPLSFMVIQCRPYKNGHTHKNEGKKDRGVETSRTP